MAFDNAQLKTIAEIQPEFRLQIPEYQRGYAWTKNQWQDLWDDLMHLTKRSTGDHYGGTLMFKRLEDCGDGRQPVEVVDGQQRLTTVALLLRALGQKSFDIEFSKNEPLQTYFDYFAHLNEAMAPRLGQHVSFYGKNIEKASDFFHGQVTLLDINAREDLVTALRTRFKLFVLFIKPEFDVHVAFETINNRGKALTTLEKLKNRLIYLSSIATDESAGKIASEDIHRCWKGIYHWLGKGSSLLGDDRFLTAHSMGWFKHEREADWLNTQLFEELFPSSGGDVTPEKITSYVKSLETAAAWWFHLNNPAGLPSNVQQQIESFNRTPFATARPLLLWALIRLGGAQARLISNPAEGGNSFDPFAKLVKQAERFSVLVLMGNDRRSNVGQGDLNFSAYCLAHPNEVLGKKIGSNSARPLGAQAAVDLSADHVKALTDNGLISESPPVYADAKFEWQGYFDPAKVSTVAAHLIRAEKGFYGWNFAKVVIYEWEQWLRGDKGRPDKKPWERFSWDDSIEHIYPQQPDDEEWKDSIAFDGRTSIAMKKAVVNSLGNLLLLSGSRNSSLSNSAFYGGKHPDRAKVLRFQAGSYSEWQVAHVCPRSWSVPTIAARGIAMMKFAENHWKFRLVEPEAPLTAWLPILFGDMAATIQEGKGSGGVRVDGRALNHLVKQFQTCRPR